MRFDELIVEQLILEEPKVPCYTVTSLEAGHIAYGCLRSSNLSLS